MRQAGDCLTVLLFYNSGVFYSNVFYSMILDLLDFIARFECCSLPWAPGVGGGGERQA